MNPFKTVCIAILAISFIGITLHDSLAQSYCSPRYSGNQAKDPFFTFIHQVELSDLAQTISRNNASTGSSYRSFLKKDTATLAKGGHYQIQVALGNGANTQTVRGWIDFNQNNVFESSERIFTQTDLANSGSHRYEFSFKVPANLPNGSTRMRVATILGLSGPNPCQNGGVQDYFQNFHDYSISIKDAAVQGVRAIKTFDTGAAFLPRGGKDKKVLGINVATNPNGVLNPLILDSAVFDFMGSDRMSDLDEADLFQASHSQPLRKLTSSDSTTNLASPFGLQPADTLAPGNNFLWLAADVDSNAVIGNQVNGRALSIHADRSFTPSPIDPQPDKTIDYCLSRGNQNNFVFIDSIGLEGIRNQTGIDNQGYSYYPNQTDTFWGGESYPLSFRIGNGANPAFAAMWIDLNQNGKFDTVKEKLWDTFYATSNNELIKDTIQIPKDLQVGQTRLRFSVQYSNVSTNKNLKPNPCTNPLTFGEAEDYTIYLSDSNRLVPRFSADPVCAGDSALFKNNSFITTGSDSITQYRWHFGTGDTSLRINPAYTYDTSGYYPVRLILQTKGGKKDSTEQWLRVENPEPAFTASDSLAGQPVQFVDKTEGGSISSHFWKFRDSFTTGPDTAIVNNPTHQYDSAGIYPVALTVKSEAGCRDSVEQQIRIYDQFNPSAYFRVPKDTVDRRAPVKFKDQSRYGQSVQWSFKPDWVSYVAGNDSSSLNPLVKFDSSVQYTIQLVVNNQTGTDTTKRSIYVEDPIKPVAQLSVSERNPVVGQTVIFKDLSANNPTYWEWYLGDKDTVYQQYPKKQYLDTGKKAITLIVGNAAGYDTLQYTNWVDVSKQYKLCDQGANQSHQYTGSLYDDGGPSGTYSDEKQCGFTINPDCPGDLKLVLDNVNIDASDYLRVFDGKDNKGKTFHSGGGFNNSNKPPDTLYSDSGAIYIELKTDFSTNAGGFQAEWFSNPNDTPKGTIVNDSPVYVKHPTDLKVNFKQGERNDIRWDFDNDGKWDFKGSDSVRHKFSKTGKQIVKAEVSNCQANDTIKKKIPVKKPPFPPEAGFIIDSSKANLVSKIQLKDTSLYGPTSRKWWIEPKNPRNPDNVALPFTFSYLNGTSNQSLMPTIAFFEAGFYDVCLSVSNQLGNDTACKPQSIFIRDQALMCNRDTTKFAEGYLVDDGGRNDDYSANLNNDTSGNGICTMLINPCAANLYLAKDTFELGPGDTLRIYDGTDASSEPLFDTASSGFTEFNLPPDTLIANSGSFYVEFSSDSFIEEEGFAFKWFRDSLKAQFNVDTGICPGEPFQAISLSQTPDNVATTQKWQMPGQSNQSGDSFKHVISQPGKYPLELTVTGQSGCQHTTSQIVSIRPNPKTKFSWQEPACEKDSLSLDNETSISDGSIAEYKWKVNGQVKSRDSLFRPFFSSTGKSSVKLVAKSNYGCIDSFARDSTIQPKPSAGFIAENRCSFDSLLFKDTSVAQTPLITKIWENEDTLIGHGDTGFLKPPQPKFNKIQLTVQDTVGCWDSITRQIPYNPQFEARFSEWDTCQYAKLPVTNLTDTGITGVNSYHWESENQIDSGFLPELNFKDTGSKRLTLISRSAIGCIDTFTNTATIAPSPTIQYNYQGVRCKGNQLTFFDSSRLRGIGIDSIRWDFRDTSILSGEKDSFAINLAEEGWQAFQVKATGANGCVRAITDSLKVNPLPDLAFSYEQKWRYEMVFEAADTSYPYYRWTFPADTLENGSGSVFYDFRDKGQYPVGLTIRSTENCKAQYQDTINVITLGKDQQSYVEEFDIYPNPVDRFLTITRKSGNSNTRIQLQLQTLSGKILRQTTMAKGQKTLRWPFSDLAKGSYLLAISSSNTNEPAFRKIVVNY